MKGSLVKGICLPDSRQELLIKAALLHGGDALAAWRKWKDSTDLDHVDGGSYRLLPLLYRNLVAEGVKHPLMGKLKGIYRRSWYENQMLFHHAADIVQSLKEAGVRVMLLKGVATVLAYYRNEYGIRPMDDCDILVPREQVETAFARLRETGWTPKTLSPSLLTPEIIPYKHAAHFRGPAGRQLDLHWHLFYECLQPDADDDFWRNAVSLDFKGLDVLVLNPADQLLHVCMHGMRWNTVPSIRWIADAMAIMGAVPAIDWDRIVSQAEKRRFVLPLRDSLGYLRSFLGAPVPDEVLERLRGMKPAKEDYLLYEDSMKIDMSKGPIRIIACKYRHFSRSFGHDGRLRKVVHFLRYLQYEWEVQFWQMPYRALFKIMNRLRKNFIWYRGCFLPFGSDKNQPS